MNDNKITVFIENYGGLIIGLLIGIVFFLVPVLYNFFKFVLVVGVCGWAGNYFQKNKLKVKEFLKNLVDKM